MSQGNVATNFQQSSDPVVDNSKQYLAENIEFLKEVEQYERMNSGNTMDENSAYNRLNTMAGVAVALATSRQEVVAQNHAREAVSYHLSGCGVEVKQLVIDHLLKVIEGNKKPADEPKLASPELS